MEKENRIQTNEMYLDFLCCTRFGVDRIKCKYEYNLDFDSEGEDEEEEPSKNIFF
ncbi:MAG: hypothetical protein MJ252_07485 [archaeon]|nr:hypothetical protein [archaeon]